MISSLQSLNSIELVFAIICAKYESECPCVICVAGNKGNFVDRKVVESGLKNCELELDYSINKPQICRHEVSSHPMICSK